MPGESMPWRRPFKIDRVRLLVGLPKSRLISMFCRRIGRALVIVLTIEGDAIICEERPLPIGLRLFILFLGIGLALIVPVTFLIEASGAAFSVGPVVMMAFIAAFMALGLFLLRVALASAIRIRLDPQTGRASRRMRGPFGSRSDSFALGDLPLPESFMRDSVEDGPFAILRLRMPKGRAIEVACGSRLEAEMWRDHIARLCGRG